MLRDGRVGCYISKCLMFWRVFRRLCGVSEEVGLGLGVVGVFFEDLIDYSVVFFLFGSCGCKSYVG